MSGCGARALFLVIWGITSLIVFFFNQVAGAIVFLIGFFIVAFVILASRRPSRTSGSQDINIYIHDESTGQGRPRRRSDIQRGLDWHVPKVNKDGADFITGASSLRKRQQDAMRRTKKRLWGD
jgi:hypothetical protein